MPLNKKNSRPSSWRRILSMWNTNYFFRNCLGTYFYMDHRESLFFRFWDFLEKIDKNTKTRVFQLFKPTTCPFFTPVCGSQPPPTPQNLQSSTTPTRLFNLKKIHSQFSTFFNLKGKYSFLWRRCQSRRCWNVKISTSFSLPQKNSKFHPCSKSMNESKSMSKTQFRKCCHPFFGINVR